MKAKTARYAAQTSNDFAAMDKLFGNDLTYNHSSAGSDDKAKYIDAMRSGRTKYRKMTPNGDLKTRTYGCIAIITGTAVYEVTAGGQDRSVPLRFTAIWAKRASGPEFVSFLAVDRHSPVGKGPHPPAADFPCCHPAICSTA